jgi:iron(III) transport system ATP-binding protein
MAVALELSSVSKVFYKDRAPVRAVDGVSLSVAPGEMVTFLGPSGCGKTTILRMVAGFETPSGGVVSIGGRDVTNVPVNRRDIGFVFQNYALFPHMSVFENVAYGLRVKGLNEAEIRRKVGEGLELVGLKGAGKSFPNQLSGGEQQRVALARVLVLEPKVLLMDEPLSNLDAKLRIHMRTEIRRIQKQLNVTCLYVTHDQGEALTMSDRIMVMNKGKVEQIGTPQELYSDPGSIFVADFIGQANIIPGSVVSSDGKTVLVSVAGVKIPVRAVKNASFAPCAPAALVVRPENLLPSEGEGMAGTILTSTFLGGRMEYEVALEAGGEVLSFDPFLPGKKTFSEGEKIRLSFDPSVAVALEA